MKRHSRSGVLVMFVSILALVTALLPLARQPAAALPATPAVSTTFVVNTTDDSDHGACTVAHCSLREAVAAVFAHPGPDTITFNIPFADPGYEPATGVWTIKPANSYEMPSQTTVDGPLAGSGGASWPAIEIDGTILGTMGFTGLYLDSNVTVRNLTVNHFKYGIWVLFSNVTVEGCRVGTDPLGATAKPNSEDGILVSNGVTGTIIQRNLLSGNGGGGIRMFGTGTSGNTVQQNRIGTNAAGTAALANGYYGIQLHAGAHDNLIQDNLVSGNIGDGMEVYDTGTNGNVFRRNLVGTDASGLLALPNGISGVSIYGGPSNNTLGPDNTFAHNAGDGLLIDGANSFTGTLGNRITANSISGNGHLGIDNIHGGNAEIAPPIITGISAHTVTGTACALCVVEVFSDSADQGAVFEGAATAGVGGAWSFSKLAGLSGPHVTVTARDGAGNTSEFSAAYSLWPTPTASATATRTPTATPTATRTSTATMTATRTPTATLTASRTRTATATRTATLPAWTHVVRLPIIVSE